MPLRRFAKPVVILPCLFAVAISIYILYNSYFNNDSNVRLRTENWNFLRNDPVFMQLSDSAIVIANSDGRIVKYDLSLIETGDSFLLPDQPTALCSVGNGIAIGTVSGKVFYLTNELQLLWIAQVCNRRIEHILNIDGSTLAFSRDFRVALLDNMGAIAHSADLPCTKSINRLKSVCRQDNMAIATTFNETILITVSDSRLQFKPYEDTGRRIESIWHIQDMLLLSSRNTISLCHFAEGRFVNFNFDNFDLGFDSLVLNKVYTRSSSKRGVRGDIDMSTTSLGATPAWGC